ncbi:MAG: hypothetical protein U1F30_07725 [Steroidobacteraceae bacterium]
MTPVRSAARTRMSRMTRGQASASTQMHGPPVAAAPASRGSLPRSTRQRLQYRQRGEQRGEARCAGCAASRREAVIAGARGERGFALAQAPGW